MTEAPAEIVGFGTGSTSYDAFLEREEIPVARDLWVKNVFELPLAPWKRKGGRGTYINLHGSGIDTVLYRHRLLSPGDTSRRSKLKRRALRVRRDPLRLERTRRHRHMDAEKREADL